MFPTIPLYFTLKKGLIQLAMNEVEEVKQRTDIVDLISQYVVLKKAGANYKGVCPFHQEKTPSMMVSPQKQIWKCFGCGKGGDQFAFIMEAEHLEFGDALRMLAAKVGVTLQPRTQADHRSAGDKERLYRINMLASRVFQKLLLESSQGKEALDYLKKRTVTEQTIKEFGIGFVPNNFDLKSTMLKHGVILTELSRAGSPERFYSRIMFPIFDVLGNVIAFTGRTLGDLQPKYLNSPETDLFNKSRVIYGLNFAKAAIKEHDYVVLVEGQMDVVALHQGGVKQTVASSGTAITERQIQILSKYTNNFILAFDSDTAGQTTTKKVIELLLKNDLAGKVIDFSPYKDAGELFEKADLNAWKKATKASIEGVEWIVQQEVAAVEDINFVESKKRVIKAILPLLSLIQDESRLDHYVQRLALLTESKPESIYSAVEKAVGPTPNAAPIQNKKPPQNLTSEEQLLAILLYYPQLIKGIIKKFEEIVWQSADASRIASVVVSCYNTEVQTTKVINQNQFFSTVKNQLDSQLAEKISSWQFWLTSSWTNLTEEIGKELATEKMAQLSTKSYERNKENIATKIRLAQEKGDLETVKKLMNELNALTKQTT